MKRWLFLLFAPVLWASDGFVGGETEQLFKEYYQDEAPVKRRLVPRPQIQPVKPQIQPQQQPQTVRRVVRQLPKTRNRHQLFGIPVSYFVGAELGRVNQDRKVRIESNKSGIHVLRTDISPAEVLGTANGNTYSFTQHKTYDRTDLLIGIEHDTGENRYYRLGFHNGDEIQEFLVVAGFTFPQLFQRVSPKLLPYAEFMLTFGYNEAEDIMPTDYGAGAGVGALFFLSRDWALSAGVDYKLRRWRPIAKSYGDEYWDDTDTRSYLGIRYFF